MERRHLKTIVITGAAMLSIAALVLLYNHDPSRSDLAPKCIFKMATGWDCPGCGSSRALYHALHLRLGQAVQCNPLLVAALPYVALLIWLQYLGGATLMPRLHRALTGRRTVIVLLAVIVVYWVTRNLYPVV